MYPDINIEDRKHLPATGYLYLIMLLLPAVQTKAQDVKLVKATAQNAYGGIAGSRSCRYLFVLQGKDIPRLQPDTLWIGDHATDLSKKNNLPQKGFRGRTPTLTVTETVHMRNSHQQPVSTDGKQDSESTLPTPPKYKGVALIVYQLNGKRHILIIPKVTEWLPAMPYP